MSIKALNPIIKKIFILIILLLPPCIHAENESAIRCSNAHIIPRPQKLTIRPGEFILDNEVHIHCSDRHFLPYADSLAQRIFRSSGISLKKECNRTACKYIAFEHNSQLGHDEYIIDINTDRILIKGASEGSIYYGLQSLLQLFPNGVESHKGYSGTRFLLPCLYIHDWPKKPYRGVLIDVCRHFFTVDELKKQIQILGALKINRLHLHLTDNQAWRIEIRKYPALIKHSAIAETYNNRRYGPFYYTQDDIRDIVSYAARHNIEIIPEIEFPGHSLSALVPFPELSCQGGPFVSEQVFGFEENVFCAGNDKVYGFMQDVLTEIAALFPSEYLHIGGDECSKTRWKQCPKCQAKIRKLGFKPDKNRSVEEQLQSYAIHRVSHFITRRLRKKVIGWHEILEGGTNKDITIMSWRDPQIGYRAAADGHDVILTPMPHGFYLCDYQGAVEVEPAASGLFSSLQQIYQYDSSTEQLNAKQRKHIIGLQACAWTEWCPNLSSLEYTLYPRTAALAENAWTMDSLKNWDDFQKRLDHLYVRLKYKNVNFHIPMPEGVLTRNIILTGDSVILKFTNSRSLPMVYTDDGTSPRASSTIVPKQLCISRACTLKVATVVADSLLSPIREIFVERQPLPGKKQQKTTNGIRLQIAEGLFENGTDYTRLPFVKDTIISSFKDFNKDKFDFRKPSVAVYTGFFYLPETDIYTFMTNNEELWIDDQLLITNPTSSRFYACKKMAFLEKGHHKFRLVFSNRLKEGFATCWYDIGFIFRRSQ